MHRRQFLGLGAASLAALLTGCSTAGAPVMSGTGSNGVAGELLTGSGARLAVMPGASVAPNLNRFAAQLFRAAVPGTKNSVISPYSVLAALGMTAYGARGQAATALAKVLGGDPTVIAQQLTAVEKAVSEAVAAGNQQTRDRTRSEFVVEAANRLFPQSGMPVRKEFLDALAAGYGAGVQTLDYRADPAAARKVINDWVADRTRTLIPELLPEQAITTDTRLALVNALYLKAPWASEFGESSQEHDFTTAEGKTVQVKMLSQGEASWRTAKGDGWQSVSIPYYGGGMAMTLIVPDQGRFAQVSEKLDGALLGSAVFGAQELINLKFPAFTTDTPAPLTDPLTSMGLGPLFDDGDLSGIAGEPGDLVATQVIHHAKIAVDKYGTEAAAATAVIVEAGSAQPTEKPKPRDIVVDRAFLYTIHDTETGTALFVGRVGDPTV